MIGRDVNPDELAAGRDRIRRWPHHDRVALTKLTEPEAALIVEAAGVLDLEPCDEPVDAILIDLRGDR